jgi:hypothetical protein
MFKNVFVNFMRCCIFDDQLLISLTTQKQTNYGKENNRCNAR